MESGACSTTSDSKRSPPADGTSTMPQRGQGSTLYPRASSTHSGRRAKRLRGPTDPRAFALSTRNGGTAPPKSSDPHFQILAVAPRLPSGRSTAQRSPAATFWVRAPPPARAMTRGPLADQGDMVRPFRHTFERSSRSLKVLRPAWTASVAPHRVEFVCRLREHLPGRCQEVVVARWRRQE